MRSSPSWGVLMMQVPSSKISCSCDSAWIFQDFLTKHQLVVGLWDGLRSTSSHLLVIQHEWCCFILISGSHDVLDTRSSLNSQIYIISWTWNEKTWVSCKCFSYVQDCLMKHLQNPNSRSWYVVCIFKAIQCSLGLSYMISISVRHEHQKKTTTIRSRKPVVQTSSFLWC